MDNRNTNMTFGNMVISWGIAGLAGLIAFLLFRIMGDWSWSAAGFGAAFIAIILIVLFTIIFGRDLPPLGSVSSPVSKGGTSKAFASATPSASATSAAPAASAAMAAGSAGSGGGAAAATSPAATGTPVGEGAAQSAERKNDEVAAKAAAAAAPAAVEGPGEKPATLDKPRGGTADDLKKIKGVGPKMETMCNNLGFWHFDQIANWTPAEVAWVDDNLEGFKGRVSRDEWVSQAKALAAGEETEFSKKVGKGGVY